MQSALLAGGAGGGGDGFGGIGGGGLADAAVAAFAFLVFDEGFEQAGAVEIGPERFGDEHFGVGDLPEEEIADAHFSAGTNQEIGIGQAVGVEVAGELIFGDALDVTISVSIDLAIAVRVGVAVAVALREYRVHRVDDLGAAAVVQSDTQAHAAVGGGAFGGFADVFLHRGRKIAGAAEKAHANIVFLDEWHFLAEIFAQELHEKISFGFGAAPVFDGKSVEGERFNVQAGAGFNGAAGRFGAVAVPRDAREMAALRPAAVAVHDDGHVARQTREVEFFEQLGFLDAHGAHALGSGDMR